MSKGKTWEDSYKPDEYGFLKRNLDRKNDSEFILTEWEEKALENKPLDIYEITFRKNGTMYLCSVEAISPDEALGLFFTNHADVSYDDIRNLSQVNTKEKIVFPVVFPENTGHWSEIYNEDFATELPDGTMQYEGELDKEEIPKEGVGVYNISFDNDLLAITYRCHVEAADTNEAVGIFLRNHSHLTAENSIHQYEVWEENERWYPKETEQDNELSDR